MSLPRLVCVVGPTASGKSALALALAEALPAGILSVDSMQVYRGVDVGTAKPTAEERARVPHFGLDLCGPQERFSTGAFLAYARDVVERETAAGRAVLAVGGTGLYLRALLHGLGPTAPADPALRARLRDEEAGTTGAMHRRLAASDPAAAARLHPRDLVRLERALEVHATTGRTMTAWQEEHGFRPAPFETLGFALRHDPAALRARIEARVDAMLAAGWLDEVRGLLRAGVPLDATAMSALGYRDLAAVLAGEQTLPEARARILRASRRFAKSQAAWFNRDPAIRWLTPAGDLPERLLPVVRAFLAGQDAPSP